MTQHTDAQTCHTCGGTHDNHKGSVHTCRCTGCDAQGEDERLDHILIEVRHGRMSNTKAKTLLASREQAAELRGRIDELSGLVNDPDCSFTIRGCQAGRCTSVEDRLKKLQATKPEKEG